MTDEVKTVETDATTALADTKAEISKLAADEKKVAGWTAIHHVYIYIYVALAFVVGAITGYFLH